MKITDDHHLEPPLSRFELQRVTHLDCGRVGVVTDPLHNAVTTGEVDRLRGVLCKLGQLPCNA